ncbi:MULTISPECIES: linear amide C-N hydrolase [unclassified Streptomyces]|uniref:linear amide C-N hydrolase n=1 Tax=unclassified Streptomyces TaxID=2593676 RepID=UPI0004BD9118|nr:MULTISPECIES: linear amide C-N hydrolase [unclassified Streptomyces]
MCTRILWNTNDHAVLAGRTMDWPESTEPVLTVFPRGIERDGGTLAGTPVVGDNPLRWTSRLGSIVTTVYGAGTADGLNEAGLAAHMLYLDSTDLGPRDPSRPGLQIALWIQYLLDGARTVQEALDLLDTCQLVPVEMRGFRASVHVALEDAAGDSAIVEYIEGQRQVHHDRSYTIMTNEPSYEEQLRLLREKVRAVQGLGHDRPNSEVPLPGNVNAVDRFQRAAYFSSLLPEPADDRQAVAGILAVTRNASVPFGAPYREGRFHTYNTEYRTICDLTSKRYFFELATSPNLLWAEIDRFDLSPGAPVLMLDPEGIDLVGNVSDRFTPAPAPF